MSNKLLIPVLLAFFSVAMIASAQDEPKKTVDNLMEAYNGESNASAMYAEFAKKADEEGYGPVASLFRATSKAEAIHKDHHAAALKGVGASPQADIETPAVFTTQINLESALDGESGETDQMYPAFLEEARRDGIESAVESFKEAGAAEAVHAKLYGEALANLEKWKGPNKEFYVCPECGNVETVRPEGGCPLCGELSENFIPVK
jgi:rubrerythrin